jgi:hypothetical protein
VIVVDDGGDESDFSLSSNARDVRAHRKIPLVEVLDELVSVSPLPKRVFIDWGALAETLVQYLSESHQTAHTVNATVRNNEIARKTQAAKNGLLVKYIPLEDAQAQVHLYPWAYGCKEHARGDGARTMRFLRGAGCPLHIIATLSDAEDQVILVITTSHYFHNHQVAPACGSGGNEDASNEANVVGMMESKCKPKAILHELLKEDNDTACLALLSQFTDVNDGTSIDEIGHHETCVISITSVFMCDMASRFSEMLPVGCTLRINRWVITFVQLSPIWCNLVSICSLFLACLCRYNYRCSC